MWYENLAYVLIECLHCGQTSHLKEFHHSVRMKCNEEPQKYFLTCPHCQKRMVITDLALKKEEKKQKTDSAKIELFECKVCGDRTPPGALDSLSLQEFNGWMKYYQCPECGVLIPEKKIQNWIKTV